MATTCPFTDSGNGEYFARMYQDKLLYNWTRQKWFEWNGSIWKECLMGQEIQYAKDAMRQRRQDAEELENTAIRDAMIKSALRCESMSSLRGMLTMAASESQMRDSGLGWDSDPLAIGVKNGIVDLRTGKLKSGERKDRVSRFCPIEYKESDEPLPLWTDFINTVLSYDIELIDWVQRAVGYSMTGNTSEKLLFFCHGHLGNNGKSVFIETLGEMLGTYSWRKFPMGEILDRRNPGGATPNIAKLPGIRFVSASEIGEGKRINEELIKDLTGGIDTINARDLYETSFTFKPQFKLWMFGNHKPLIKGTDNAIWERIGLIPFLVSIPPEKRDRELGKKFFSALPNIFAWGVRGVRAWLDKGLELPSCIRGEVSAYRDEMNPIKPFIDERLEFDESYKMRVGEMYDTYKGWKMNQMEAKYVLGTTTFAHRMEQIAGVTRRKREVPGVGNVWYWIGVRVKGLDDTKGNAQILGPVH